MSLRSRRRLIFASALAVYLGGFAAGVLTHIPSAFSMSIALIACAAWAYGPAAGAAVMASCLGAEFAVLSLTHSRGNTYGVEPVLILLPVVVTELVVLVGLSGLYHAERRQLAVEAEVREKNAALEAALAEVRELRGMLPICAWCKSVRDVDGMWDQLEAYLEKHANVTLTHGICPKCAAAVEAELRAKAG